LWYFDELKHRFIFFFAFQSLCRISTVSGVLIVHRRSANIRISRRELPASLSPYTSPYHDCREATGKWYIEKSGFVAL
jgi:hypothetical protein